MSTAIRASDRALEMRHEFDRSFALPAAAIEVAREQLLAIRIGAQPYAVRLSEIAGLHAGKSITRVPGANAALIGIAGFRGVIAPVYDLSSLMGQAADDLPHWLIVAAQEPIAFGFNAFEGQLRVMPEAILPRQSAAGDGAYAKDFVQTDDLARPILSLQSLIGAIKT